VEVVVGGVPDADWEMMKVAWRVLGNMNQIVIEIAGHNPRAEVISIAILIAVDGPGSKTENVSVTFDHHVCYIH
jgi:hypothetical protein